MSAAVNPASALAECRDITVELERREKARRGGNRDDVRGRLATRLRVAPGTLEGLVRNRLKRLDTWVHARLRRAWIAELRAEAARHETELALARRYPGLSTPDEIAEAQAALDDVRARLAHADGLAPPALRAAEPGRTHAGWSDAA